MELSPSILSANFYNLKNDIESVINENCKYIHLDVMDGMFVPNISFGLPIIKKIKENVKDRIILDTHLMIERPERYIDDFKNVGADIITIHKESTIDYIDVVSYIKGLGVKAGISINPNTNISDIDDALKIVDLVLVMSVNPGFGGQSFIENSLDKVKYLKEQKNANNYDFLIEIDGGINVDNMKKVVDAGVDIVVAGTSVFKGNIIENIKKLRSLNE